MNPLTDTNLQETSYFSPTEAAEQTGCTVDYLTSLAREGTIGFKLGGEFVFTDYQLKLIKSWKSSANAFSSFEEEETSESLEAISTLAERLEQTVAYVSRVIRQNRISTIFKGDGRGGSIEYVSSSDVETIEKFIKEHLKKEDLGERIANTAREVFKKTGDWAAGADLRDSNFTTKTDETKKSTLPPPPVLDSIAEKDELQSHHHHEGLSREDRIRMRNSLSITQTAEDLKVSKVKLYSMMNKHGVIPANHGNRKLISAEDIERLRVILQEEGHYLIKKRTDFKVEIEGICSEIESLCKADEQTLEILKSLEARISQLEEVVTAPIEEPKANSIPAEESVDSLVFADVLRAKEYHVIEEISTEAVSIAYVDFLNFKNRGFLTNPCDAYLESHAKKITKQIENAFSSSKKGATTSSLRKHMNADSPAKNFWLLAALGFLAEKNEISIVTPKDKNLHSRVWKLKDLDAHRKGLSNS